MVRGKDGWIAPGGAKAPNLTIPSSQNEGKK
jgi:hypothetical protein